jgi:hypothetical protein
LHRGKRAGPPLIELQPGLCIAEDDLTLSDRVFAGDHTVYFDGLRKAGCPKGKAGA